MTLSREAVAQARAATPGCAGRIHLNNAGAGLMPASVLEVIREHLELEATLGGYEAAAARQAAIQAAYDSVAGLIGCAPHNVAFVENATVAQATALSSIPFQAGDVILTSENDYISNQIMFLSMARRLDVRIVRAPDLPEGGIDPAGVERLVGEHRPRLVALTHVPTNSGLVQDVEAVGRICRAHDTLYLVDACQSVGQLPVDTGRLGCDFLAASSRKFLRGPRGSGFLFVSDGALEAGLEPLFLDMQGARWTDADVYEPVATAARFENWEFAYALLLGTGEAARIAAEMGLDAIAQRTGALAQRLRGALGDAGLRVLDRGARRCGVVTVEIPGVEPGVLQASLAGRRINASISIREYAVIDFDRKRVPWALRLSPHYYNLEEEIDAAAAVVAELAVDLRGASGASSRRPAPANRRR